MAKLVGPERKRLRDAVAILDELVLSRDFLPFLTVIAYLRLD
jgi:hypothetical protein